MHPCLPNWYASCSEYALGIPLRTIDSRRTQVPQGNITRRNLLRFAGIAAATAAISATGCAEKADESRLQTILDAMSLEQKIAQMIVPRFSFESFSSDEEYVPLTTLTPEIAASIAEHGFGGVILFADNVEGNEQVARLIDAMQRANGADEAAGRVPLLVAADQEGGLVTRLTRGTKLTGSMALGASPSIGDTEKSAEIIGAELAALGFNVDFAPDADVNSNPANPIIGVRSFSDDGKAVADHVAAFIKGLHEHDVAAAAKHFPGHGDTSVDSHTGMPAIEKTLDEVRAVDLVPFEKAIASGVDMIMTAHIQFPNIESETYTAPDGSSITLPATLSKAIIGDLLRGELGFEGVICTDSLVMDAVAKYVRPEDSARLAINAGVDILLIPVDDDQPVDRYLAQLGEYIAMVAGLVEDGAIDRSLIDAAAARILDLKGKLGILDLTFSDEALESRVADALATVGSSEHHEQELEIAKRAVTLVKNDGVFPLGEGLKTLVLVPYGSQVNSSVYATRLAAQNGAIASVDDVTVICYGDIEPDAFDEELAEAVRAADVTVCVSAMYDMDDIQGSFAAILDKAIATCRDAGRTSVVISAQLPYDLARFTDADALLACYLASGMPEIPEELDGETPCWGPNIVAAIGIALGDGKPEGKLPVDVPMLVETGEGYGFAEEILFARGAGLSL